MQRLILLCGPAFAGKSTVRSHLVVRYGLAYVSLDEINRSRGLPFGGEGLPAEEWGRTFEIAQVRLRELMAGGGDIVVDDTLCFRWLRDDLRHLADEAGYASVLVYLNPGEAVLRERRRVNRLQPDRPDVRDDVFDEHLRLFEPPEIDEHAHRVTSLADVDLVMREAHSSSERRNG